MTITQEEFMSALERAGATIPPVCSACGGEHWIAMGLGGEQETVMLVTGTRGKELGDDVGVVDLIGEDQALAFAAHGLYCATCGFIRLHHPQPLGL